jgi:predicted porin
LWSIKEENLSMNKKLMALAVAGALGAPAAAMAQNYSIYGRLTLGVDSYEAKGATTNPAANDFTKRARVFDNGSRVGFRGTEDLGGGVQAVFLIESGVNVDNGSTTGQGGQTNTSTANWGSRTGYVGLDGSIGRVTYGRDNVWWGNGAIEQVGANWLNAGGQLYSGSFGRGMSVGITRQSNLMQYTSPTFSGVNFVVSLSPSRAEAQPTGTNADGKLMGVTAQGTHGPLAWGIDYVVDEGNSPSTAPGSAKQGSTTGTKIRVGFRYMPAGQISVLSVASELEAGGPTNAAASGTGLVASCATSGCILEQTGIGISWDHMFGPFQPIFQYYTIDKISGSGCTGTVCDNTGANQITLALRYIFSKRTHAYLSYNKVDNETNYNQDFNGASLTSRTGTAQVVGADPTIIAVGLMHNF